MNLSTFLRRAAAAPPAVVLQASQANGYGVIRDLARYGIPSLALDPDPAALGFLSRHAHGMVCPDPATHEAEFVERMLEVGWQLPQRGVVFPTHDEYVWAVSRNADRLEPYYHIPFSRWETMSRVADKEQQLKAAWKVGVDTPPTIFLTDAGQLAEAAEQITFPAILKPVHGVEFKRRFGRQVLKVSAPEALEDAWRTVDGCGAMMLQDIIPGGDDELYTVGSYLDARSRPLAVFTGRKIRQHPRTFGTARFAESVWIQELADAGLRLLAELGYHGISQVEFKRDARDGSFRLMEVNARHWLWHSLAACCGVDLSYVAYRDAIDKPFVAARQVDGRRWALSLVDLLDSTLEISRGELSPAVWLKSMRGIRVDGMISLSDPRPGATSAVRLVRRLARRRRTRRRRDRTQP